MSIQRGFTLIELVIVIVLLAIVATISVQFVSFSTQGAIDTAARQQRALAGVVISEQISRALRNALPTSVRTTTDGRCIEWFPVRAASVYIDLPRGSNPVTFEAVPLPAGQSAAGRVVVYGYSGDVYSPASPGPISPTASLPAGSDTVTLNSPHRFTARSPEQRFFIVGDPVTYCQQGRFLYRYRNYGINNSVASGLPTGFPGRELLAADLVTGSVNFSVTPPTLQRSAVVELSFALVDSQSGETLNISQEVQIRNVP